MRGRAALCFVAAGLALALALPAAGAAPQPPVFTAPISDIELQAGTFLDPPLPLTDHFARPPAGTFDYWEIGVSELSGANASELSVRAEGGVLQVAAFAVLANDHAAVRLEACSVQGSERACAQSNEFMVRVVAAPSGGSPSPLPQPTIQGSAGPGGGQFTLKFAEPIVLDGPAQWFVDNEFAGQGDSVDLSAQTPGPHMLLVIYRAHGTFGSAMHAFTVLAPSAAASSPWPLAFLTLTLLGAAAVAGPARIRSALLLALLGGVVGRVRRDSLLDHFNRGALHQIIKENPGIHFGELRRRVGISHGTAIHHLRVLEAGGYVKCMPVGPYTTYFTTEKVPEPDSYGLSPPDRAVLSLVDKEPGIALSALAKQADRSLANTSRTVRRLAALGFVTTERENRKVFVFPRPMAASGTGTATGTAPAAPPP